MHANASLFPLGVPGVLVAKPVSVITARGPGIVHRDADRDAFGASRGRKRLLNGIAHLFADTLDPVFHCHFSQNPLIFTGMRRKYLTTTLP